MIGLDPIKKSMVAWKLGAGGWLLAFFRCHFASLIPFCDQMYGGRVNTSQLKIDLNFVSSSQLSSVEMSLIYGLNIFSPENL